MSVRIALVVGSQGDIFDENSLQVVDIRGIQPVGDNIFVIKTDSFDQHTISAGAGENLTQDEKSMIIDAFIQH